MTQFTHTHREHSGKYTELAQHQGAGPLAGQWLVIYLDVDKGVQSATTQEDWLANWREVARDDCSVCLGSGHDHIKGNKSKPCGGCYGLGKLRQDGEAPADLWEIAGIATGIIRRQQQELGQLRQVVQLPEVAALLEQRLEAAMGDSVTRQEQEWRGGKGHGPGGRRHTGD